MPFSVRCISLVNAGHICIQNIEASPWPCKKGLILNPVVDKWNVFVVWHWLLHFDQLDFFPENSVATMDDQIPAPYDG